MEFPKIQLQEVLAHRGLVYRGFRTSRIFRWFQVLVYRGVFLVHRGFSDKQNSKIESECSLRLD